MSPRKMPEVLGWDPENELDPGAERIVCGCDEAGRGPLAGPVCGAAVILPRGILIEGLNDSKKLSEKKRDALYDRIIAEAISYAIVMIEPDEIDRINILAASLLAMKTATERLNVRPDHILVDGNSTRGFDERAVALVKGDAKSPSIAAASILAKVTRDRYMIEADARFPGYGFAAHKGYPTEAHYAAIREKGITPIHRLTFLKKMH